MKDYGSPGSPALNPKRPRKDVGFRHAEEMERLKEKARCAAGARVGSGASEYQEKLEKVSEEATKLDDVSKQALKNLD